MIVLKDKGKNSKIYIPRTKITNVTGGNNTSDLTDYYTKEEVDELVSDLSISYVVCDYSENDVVEIVDGDISRVIEDYKNNKPIMIFAPVDNKGKMGVVNTYELLPEEKYGQDYLVGYVNFFNGDEISFRRYTFSVNGTNGYSNQTKSFNNYYLKYEVDKLIENVDVDLSEKITDVQEWVEQQGYLTSIPDDVVTEEELEDILNNIDFSLPTITVYNDDSSIDGDVEGVINAITNSEDCNVLYKTDNTLHKATGYYTASSLTYVRAYFYYLSSDRMARRYIDITKNTPYTASISSLTFPNIPVDNLTSTSKVLPLSANQGKVLNETKQDTLVSGTNIKTINGNSLLGSGDIVVEGGGSSNIVELTQSEYDALGDNVDADTLYLISDATISANYKTINGESILGEGDIELGGGESVAYLIIKENPSENTYSYSGGSFEDVVNAYNNNKPYFIYVPNGAGVGYYSLAETTIITDTYIQCLSFAHTGTIHTWRYWRLYSDIPTLYNQNTYEYATVSQVNAINTQIGDINNILENIIG